MDEQIRKHLCYHYTSVESFIKMLDGVENGKIKFHASSIFSLNDPTEMGYGYEEIIKKLSEIEEELDNCDKLNFLSTIWSTDPQLSPELWKNLHLGKMKKTFQHSSVISFSRAKDLLSMWGMYGNNGKGVALGFDLRIYFRKERTKDGTTVLDSSHIDLGKQYGIDVVYGSIPNMSLPYSLVKSEYLKYCDRIQKVDNKEKIIDEQINTLTQMAIIAAPFVKHPAYETEKESRIIQVHEKISEIKFKSNGHGEVKPYIEVDIPADRLKEVVVGPCCDFDMIKNCIEIKMVQKEIKTEEIDIIPSSVPYRA